MSEPIRGLDIHIESSQSARNLAVIPVANFLTQLQTLVYHVGDYVAGGEFRVRGHPQQAIIDRCELIFEELGKGSVVVTVGLHDKQTTLLGPSLGEEAVTKGYEIMQRIANADKVDAKMIGDVISDPLHRARILNDLERMWPEEGKGYKVTIGPHKAEKVPLSPLKKFYIEELLKREGGQKDQVIVRGVLHTITSRARDKMTITGPDGTISLPMVDIPTAKKYFDRPIVAYGEGMFDAAGNVAELLNVSKIQPFTSTKINRVFADKNELPLSEPLEVQIDWSHKQWMMRRDDLNIVAMGKDYDECLKDFYNQFFFVWREYGLAQDASLGASAKGLRKTILALVKEPSHL